MLTAGALLLGAAMLALVMADQAVRRWPVSPALAYLTAGWAAGFVLSGPGPTALSDHAPAGVVLTEGALLVSLLAVGLRLRPAASSGWRVALALAGPGVVVTMLLAAGAGMLLFGLDAPTALLLGGILAPTDPVLASEVRIRADDDRDAVRLALSAEGGLNDGSAWPGVMLALGLMGLHAPERSWWWSDLLWPVAGGLLVGIAAGLALGRLLAWRVLRGDEVARDELLMAGCVVIAFGLGRATGTSTFVVAFALGAMLLVPLRHRVPKADTRAVGERLHAFGARLERLVEAAVVLALGFLLHGAEVDARHLLYGLLLALVARPVAVMAVVRQAHLRSSQRRLVAWFGIRGIGSMFYLLLALEHGVTGETADTLVAATLVAVTVSIVLHGVSATPVMTAYHRRRGGR